MQATLRTTTAHLSTQAIPARCGWQVAVEQTHAQVQGTTIALQLAKGQLCRFPVGRVYAAQPLADGQLGRHPQAGRQPGVQSQACLAQSPLPPARPQLQLQAVQAFILLLQVECGQAADQRLGIGGTGTERIRCAQGFMRPDTHHPGLDNMPLRIGQQVSFGLRQQCAQSGMRGT
ncbi:hypothetical protein D3C77_545830 [compost metagenome]